MKKVSQDKTAAEKFKEAFRAALLKAGKDAGFKFTREELDAALVQLKSEIPEGDLKGVAGGETYDPCQPAITCKPVKECYPFRF